MGMLIEGKWVDDDADIPPFRRGVRPAASSFDDWVTADGSSGFKAEPGRYHLFLAPNCPWAHRTPDRPPLERTGGRHSRHPADLPRRRSWPIAKGSDVTSSRWTASSNCTRPKLGKPSYTGRVTVPTLWDKQRWTIVNNKSSQIIRMLNTEFNEWGDARWISTPRNCAARSTRSTTASTAPSTMVCIAAASPDPGRIRGSFWSCSRRWTA